MKKDQKTTILKEFSNTTDVELATKLGLSVPQVRYYAKVKGIKKNPQYISALRRKQANTTNNKRWNS